VKYGKLLVPLDGSKTAEQSLPYVRLFADLYPMPIELLTVNDDATNLQFSSLALARDYLEWVAAQEFSAAPAVDKITAVGKPAEIIVERAKLDPCCLIFMTTHGYSGLKRWLLGSVASKVIHAAVNPLLLIRAAAARAEKGAPRLESVIVPLDGSAPAETALPHALELAHSMRLEVVLARAFELPATAYYRSDDCADAEVFLPTHQKVVAAAGREARAYLEAKVREIRASGVTRVRWEILQGAAADELIDLSRAVKNSLIAIATHGRSGVKRWALGSVTEKIVQQAESPMLIIRAPR
jgi:nucleotide-binding universal stress UspA family protein